jgi:hypothetical protein
VKTLRRDEAIPYARIEQVRLTYRPANISSHGFRATLTFTDGRTLTFGNLDWMSLVDVRRRDEPYKAFLFELMRRVAAANPRCRFVAGRPAWLWGVTLAAFGVMGLAFGAFTLQALRNAQYTAAGIGAFFALAALFQLTPFITRNRPRPFSPEAPPADLLP